jgi:hypothetical protein
LYKQSHHRVSGQRGGGRMNIWTVASACVTQRAQLSALQICSASISFSLAIYFQSFVPHLWKDHVRASHIAISDWFYHILWFSCFSSVL